MFEEDRMFDGEPDDDSLGDLEAMLHQSNDETTQEELDQLNVQKTVIIGTDYRKPEELGSRGKLEGYRGIMLGLYDFNPEFTHIDELTKVTDKSQLQINPDLFPNPLIYVPAAKGYIWGVQSDWTAVESGSPPEFLRLVKLIGDSTARGIPFGDIDLSGFDFGDLNK